MKNSPRSYEKREPDKFARNQFAPSSQDKHMAESLSTVAPPSSGPKQFSRYNVFESQALLASVFELAQRFA